jgi:hypothetical protein
VTLILLLILVDNFFSIFIRVSLVIVHLAIQGGHRVRHLDDGSGDRVVGKQTAKVDIRKIDLRRKSRQLGRLLAQLLR